MNPSVHLRVDSVIRALEEVILPAVGADERAADQLRMAIAHLGVIRAQIDTASQFERFELANYERLATTLVETAGGRQAGPAGERDVETACRALAGVLQREPPLDAAGVRARTDELGRAIETMVAASAEDGDEDLRSAAMTALLRSERQRVDANRSMFLGMGWEPGDGLADIASVVGNPRQAL